MKLNCQYYPIHCLHYFTKTQIYYKKEFDSCSFVLLDDKEACIFILKVNDDIAPLGKTVGKTIFGRNDLFWFAFDAFGTFYMLDNLTLTPLRRYDDAYRAITDCLISGKI